MAAYVPWALFSMVTYGLTAVFLKLAFRGLSPSLVLVVGNFAIVAAGIVWMTSQGAGSYRGLGVNQPTFWLIASSVVLAASIVAYYKALSLGPASVVVPVFALSFSVAVVLGFLVLDEPFKMTRLLGALLAVAAIGLLTR
jgi:transporter family protein